MAPRQNRSEIKFRCLPLPLGPRVTIRACKDLSAQLARSWRPPLIVRMRVAPFSHCACAVLHRLLASPRHRNTAIDVAPGAHTDLIGHYADRRVTHVSWSPGRVDLVLLRLGYDGALFARETCGGATVLLGYVGLLYTFHYEENI